MVENDASDGVGQWCKTTRGIGNSKLRTLTILFFELLMFLCIDLVCGLCCLV